MSLVTVTDFDTSAFILEWLPQAIRNEDAVLAQDAARSGDLEAYTLLGKDVGTAGAVTPDLTTGDGTVTGFEISTGKTPSAGDYLITFTAALLFTLTKGNEVLASGVAITDGGEKTIEIAGLLFIVTDGATAFAAGDKFTLTVTAGTGKYVPFAADGEGGATVPNAIMLNDDVLEASIQAGDVDICVLEFGAIVDEDKTVIEGSATLDTIISVGGEEISIRDFLNRQSIRFRETEQIMRGI